MEHHHYPPLPSSSCIRVLKLEFNAFNPNLDVEFRLIDLEDAEHSEYYALSYACGITDPVEYVNFPSIGPTARMGIGKTLSEAFLRLRREALERMNYVKLLWVDAICINQKDLDERAHQVRIMHRIFGSAQLVLSWLGEGDENDLEATHKLLYYFANPMPRDDNKLGAITWTKCFAMSGYYNEGESGVQLRHHILDKLKSTNSKDEFNLLHDFFNRPWFTRLWVVQEVTVAKHMALLCGRRIMIDYNIVGMAACWFYAVVNSTAMQGLLRPVTRNAATTTFIMRQDYQALRQKLSLQTRPSLGRLQFSEPRDEVFAIVGILDIPREVSSLWEIDYSKTVWRVLADATRGTLLREGLNALNQACAPDRPLYDDRPSWVPNRRCQGRTWIASLYRRFSASRNTRSVIVQSDDERFLSLSGTQVQTVENCFHINTGEDLDADRDCIVTTCDSVATMYHSLRSLLRTTQATGHKDDAANLDEIFANMTTCGADSFEQDLVNPDSHMVDDFRQFAYTWARTKLHKQVKSCAEIAASIFADLADKVDLDALPDDHGGWVFNRYVQAMLPTCKGGSLIFTSKEKICFGISSRHAEAGDIVTILEGAKFPMILRRSEPAEGICTAPLSTDSAAVSEKETVEMPSFRNENAWKLVGPAYIEGFMNGEAFGDDDEKLPEFQVYNII